ncbi:DUF982 domain-containing protein [Aquibium sp. ELW1220]|uniref:DUF982 domain-containing protein n=1 Tax=Aquibium sp. ELW1220 TaxID=2976766 RepID=UPI0025AF5924|nr:DUF982 domain-containing protein [Aquibium sp. ELW1220]MDN2583944.1 DUF982 domain-containing protein [Aquibium sp. ELW1220]
MQVNMESGWFDAPVTVLDAREARPFDVTNTRQAAEMLLHRWPNEWSGRHRAARLACLAVLKGFKPPVLARRAFAEAAREAEILADHAQLLENADMTKDIRMAETQDLPFERAVTVSDPVGTIEIGSVRAARDYLQNVDWPSGASQEDALNAAQGALDGVLAVSDSRDRFVDAARQAGVLVFE